MSLGAVHMVSGNVGRLFLSGDLAQVIPREDRGDKVTAKSLCRRCSAARRARQPFSMSRAADP